jgi:hypothetical protein
MTSAMTMVPLVPLGSQWPTVAVDEHGDTRVE